MLVYSRRTPCVLLAAIGLLPILALSAKAETIHLLCEFRNVIHNGGPVFKTEYDVDIDRQEVSWSTPNFSGVHRNDRSSDGSRNEIIITSRLISVDSVLFGVGTAYHSHMDIDRVTGRYSATRVLITGEVTHQEEGKCEKRDTINKF